MDERDCLYILSTEKEQGCDRLSRQRSLGLNGKQHENLDSGRLSLTVESQPYNSLHLTPLPLASSVSFQSKAPPPFQHHTSIRIVIESNLFADVSVGCTSFILPRNFMSAVERWIEAQEEALFISLPRMHHHTPHKNLRKRSVVTIEFGSRATLAWHFRVSWLCRPSDESKRANYRARSNGL